MSIILCSIISQSLFILSVWAANNSGPSPRQRCPDADKGSGSSSSQRRVETCTGWERLHTSRVFCADTRTTTAASSQLGPSRLLPAPVYCCDDVDCVAQHKKICNAGVWRHGWVDRAASQLQDETLVPGRCHTRAPETVHWFVYNMGLIRKKNVEDYWSKKHPSQATPFFAFVMPFRKFAM